MPVEGQLRPGRLISRDSNIGEMRLSRFFKNAEHPTIFAMPISLTPTQRLDHSLINYASASSTDSPRRCIFSRDCKLSDFLPKMKAEFNIPESVETRIKFIRPGSLYNPSSIGEWAANHQDLIDCTQFRPFSPLLRDGTLLVLVPLSQPMPPLRQHLNCSCHNHESSSSEQPAPTEQVKKLPVWYTDFEHTIPNGSISFLPAVDTHKSFFEKATAHLNIPKASLRVYLEFDDILGNLNVDPDSLQHLSASILWHNIWRI